MKPGGDVPTDVASGRAIGGLPVTHMLAGAQRLSEGRERIRPLTEADVRRIVREELNEVAKRIVRDHTGQRARLMTGCVRP